MPPRAAGQERQVDLRFAVSYCLRFVLRRWKQCAYSVSPSLLLLFASVSTLSAVGNCKPRAKVVECCDDCGGKRFNLMTPLNIFVLHQMPLGESEHHTNRIQDVSKKRDGVRDRRRSVSVDDVILALAPDLHP